MRTSRLRTPALILVAAVALTLSSCSSNNEGKIVGKWKVTDSTKAEDIKQMQSMGMFLYFEFAADGNFFLGIDSDKPGMTDILKLSGKELRYPGKYKLGSGDTVNFSDFKGPDGKGFSGKDKARSNVTIAGDKMTIKDPDGTTMQLVKWTPSAPAAQKDGKEQK